MPPTRTPNQIAEQWENLGRCEEITMASSGSMNDLSEGVGIIGTQINHLNNNIERGLGKSDKIAEELSEITRVLWSISTSLDHINNSISSLEGTLEEGIRKAQL